MSYIWHIFILLFVSFFKFSDSDMIFQRYCLNEAEPKIIPAHGEDSSGSLIMSPKPENNSWYRSDLNCSVTLTAEENFRIFLTFSNISLRNSSMDNLTVIFNNDNSDIVLAGQQVCSNENCEGLKFESGSFSNITLRFISANVTVPSNVTGFQAQYTVFDFANTKTGACVGRNRFLCENKHCISYNLICDGHNNCGDLSDETKCVIPVRNTVWAIVVIVIALVAVVIFVPLFIFLAMSGTRSIIKTVTVPNQATPLLNAAVGHGEGTNLLTSSEAFNDTWPGSSSEGLSGYGAAASAQHGTGAVWKKEPIGDSSEDSPSHGFV